MNRPFKLGVFATVLAPVAPIALITLIASLSACKARQDSVGAAGSASGLKESWYETKIINPNEPATTMDAQGKTCENNATAQQCSIWIYFHPATGGRFGERGEDLEQIEWHYGERKKTGYPHACSADACRALARAYFTTGYTTMWQTSAALTHAPVAVQWQFNDGTWDDSDGLICAAQINQENRTKVEGISGQACGKGEPQP